MEKLTEIEFNILESIKSAENGVNKVLFLLLSIVGLSLYATLINEGDLELFGFTFEESEISLFYLLVGIAITILVGISGIRVTNYIIKRFLYDKLCYSMTSSERQLRFELIGHSIFEIVYDKLLGFKFGRRKLKYDMRILTFVGFMLLIIASNVIGIYSITISVSDDTSVVKYFGWSSLIIFGLISTGIWMAFYHTIRRRKKQFKRKSFILLKKHRIRRN